MANDEWGSTRKPASGAVSAATPVVPVQVLDAAGNVLKTMASMATAGFVRLTNGTIEALLSAANTARAATNVVLEVQHLDAAGKVLASGADAAAAVFVQGAGMVTPGAAMVFGDPAAVPPHSTALAGNVLAAAAQAEAIACASPVAGKAWGSFQALLYWTVPPPAPADGVPDMVVMMYWSDGVTWNVFPWAAKWVDGVTVGAADIDDLRNFSNVSDLPFPANAVAFAVGVAGYVDGELHVRIIPKA